MILFLVFRKVISLTIYKADNKKSKNLRIIYEAGQNLLCFGFVLSISLSLQLSAVFIRIGEYLKQLRPWNLFPSAEFAPLQEWYSFANTYFLSPCQFVRVPSLQTSHLTFLIDLGNSANSKANHIQRFWNDWQNFIWKPMVRCWTPILFQLHQSNQNLSVNPLNLHCFGRCRRGWGNWKLITSMPTSIWRHL